MVKVASKSKVKLYTLKDIQEMPQDQHKMVVENLIYENGKSVLVAKPKFGKSWLALALSIAVANGDPILGLKTRMCPALYLDFDRRFLTNTVHSITSVQLTHEENWMIAQPTGLCINHPEDFKVIDELIAMAKPKLVVIDHKSACFLGKENDDEPNKVWTRNIDELHAKYGAAFLVVCQAPKGWNPSNDIIDMPYGGRQLGAWLDTMISISKSGKTFRKLQRVGNYDGELELTYNKDFRVVSKDIEEVTIVELAKELLAERWSGCVKPHVSAVIKGVAKNLGCSQPPVWDAYKELKQEESIRVEETIIREEKT